MDMQRVPVREAFYEARFVGNRRHMPPMQSYRVYSYSVKRLPPSNGSAAKAAPLASRFPTLAARLRWLRAIVRPSRNGRPALALRKRADRDVVPVWVSQRELLGPSIGVDVRIFFELCDKTARPLQRRVEIVDTKEQEKPIAWCRVIRTYQGGMLMGAPLMETEQHSAVRVDELTKVRMARRRLGLSKQRLVPLETPRHVPHPDDGPRAFHIGCLTRKR